MRSNVTAVLPGIVCLLLAGACPASTPTENLGIRALPAPGKVTIDGKADDWDLSGGIFACDNVESQRENFGVWIHLMYDAQNLYVLAHWADDTPLNNPGQTVGDYGFQADCLQMRIITAPGTPQALGNHMTCWKGRDGKDIVFVEVGTDFKGGTIKDAKATHGAQQAFTIDADGKGYIQELAFPWKLLAKDGQAPKAGDKLTVTVEPNFTTPAKGRLTVKDIFKSGLTPDRVFTFMASQCWGTATIEAKGNVAPQPVRLADGREFPVKLEQGPGRPHGGAPTVDWSGLIKRKELPGFKTIKLTMPVDGYISLNISKPDGTVVRQLLNMAFVSKGEHEVKWDGLTNLSWNQPGQPVEPGEYVWNALYHTGIGLRLKGWACNGGSAPWDGATGKENWGGDHGLPVACAADADGVYLGWSGAEAGKALVACDLQGNVKWKNSRQGMCGAESVAADGGFVYAVNWGPNNTNYVYRLNAKDGSYACFEGSDSPDIFPRNLWPDPKGKPDRIDGLFVKEGVMFLSYTKENAIMVIEARNGKLLRTMSVLAPTCIADATDRLPAVAGRLPALIYVVSGGTKVLAVSPWLDKCETVIEGLSNAKGITTDKDGRVYVAVRDPDQQVKVFNMDGKPLAEIGRKGGRARLGPWTPDGMLEASGIAVDSEGKLWVMESDSAPKRVSVWDTKAGKFVKEFFGPSSYGALGGAINPADPGIMIGQGCEWRLDPKTGRATCLGTITRGGMENSRFAIGPNGKVYLAVAGNWSFNTGPLCIYERVGDADYKLRTVIYYADANGKEIPMTGHGESGKAKKTMVWADENGDGQRQPEECSGVDGELRFSGWYMSFLPNMTMYANHQQFKVAGFTACGAPKYDLSKPTPMPKPPINDMWGLGSADDKYYLYDGPYGVNHGQFACMDVASGRMLWTYPSNFVGVHGSHNACPPEAGMVRGSFGACGAAKLPDPIGNIWVIATNVGEWHMLTERGYYLTRLFEGDPMKMAFPEKAEPGAIVDNCPPGMGGEDFGGSICYAKDGNLYLQAGKTAFWNVQLVGLDTVKEMKGDRIQIAADDVKQARVLREQQLQAAVGTRRMTVNKKTIALTGDFEKDFKVAEIVSFKKTDDAAVRAAAAWDDQNLYLGWDVNDATPWGNGAEVAEEMYVRGDTVDFQIGADPKADKNRSEAVLGDLRVSIGSFKGTPTAVLYRKAAKDKKPKTFSSGVVKEYVMDYVAAAEGASIKVNSRKNEKRYTVEAAIPLAALDLKPAPDLTLRGDFGVTHGDQASQRTRLRTYWSNQHTGIVDDVVFELQMEPKNWGELLFKQ
ncbi:MAG: hypothetical protein NTW87_07955 [Planctomycetota bacterium]|nr:hypothetical protein [Planctomycetota bacterium]